MNGVYQHYIIDLSSNNNFVQIPTVQGDGNNIRGFEVELIENGVQYEIDQNDCIIAIMGTKPDTSQIMNDCQLTDDGYIQVDITSQMSAVKGRGDYQIVLMSKSTNSQLKSFPFHIFTTPAAFDIDHIVSTDEFQTLTRNIVKTEEVIEEANDTISDMRDLESSVEKAEKTRVNAEKNRIDAESTRQSDESTRQSNENTRKTNENIRKANEISRQNAETDRDNAETDRDNAESSRMSNEAARQNNETIRQTNENIRQTNTAAAIANTNTATERANNAAIICEDIIGESGIVAQKATEAASSAASAATSAANALASEKNAKTSETNAAKSELAAATSAANAANSEAAADEKAAEALNYSKQAKSYAVGGTGTRAEEDIDNAKYYYEQARGISSGLAGTLMPMGTVTFANLPTLSSVDSGWMYNISDQFTTTSDFKEGSGHIIPAGANVYKTADEKWDVLAGTPVTGIKGSAESSYRKGNVDLTAENIGLGKVPNVSTNDQTPTFTQATARANIASGEKLSTIMGKIMKFFADLNPVAFSGKYTDLTDTPSIPTSSNIYQRHDALSDGVPIVTNSTDWNTLISPGSYKVTSGSTIADGINAPTGEYGNGLMFVIRNIDSNNQSYIFQLYFPTVPRYSAMWIRYSYGTNVDTTGSLVWGYWVKSPWVNNNNYVYGMGERVYFTNADNTVTKAGIVMQNYRSYGIEMLIGAGGNTFIGAGESVVYAPQWLSDNTVEWPHGKPAYDGPGGEIMYFTSDSGFYFLSNMGSLDNNGAVRGRFICIDTNSHLYPSEDRAQQLGRSGNSWSKVWANEIGMGGTTDNSRIVWDTDGILRCFGAKAVRIGMDSVYWDVNERADLIPSSNGAQSIGRSDHIIGNMYVENVQTYQNLVLHGVSADGFDITSILNGGGDGLIRLAAYSRYYRFGLDGDGNYLDIYRESTTNSMCIFGKGGVAPIKIGKDPSRYIEIDYDGGSSVPVIRSGHNSMMLEMIGGSLIVRDSRNGKPYLPVAASAFNVNSSVRYKENIQEMTEEQALDIMRYRVLTYDYKEECGGAKDQQGLLAEDVYEINPYPVTLDEEGRPDAIDYSKFVPQLIKMVQIQQKQINNLKNEIAMQENDKNS